MQQLPHTYAVTVNSEPNTNLTASAENLPNIQVAPPSQFGGPGDQWSPEDLLMAAVANCFVLSFKAIAKPSKVNWTSINCVSEGMLEKAGGKVVFTKVVTKVKLTLSPGQNAAAAERAITKAEEICLITNSLSSEAELEFQIIEP